MERVCGAWIMEISLTVQRLQGFTGTDPPFTGGRWYRYSGLRKVGACS